MLSLLLVRGIRRLSPVGYFRLWVNNSRLLACSLQIAVPLTRWTAGRSQVYLDDSCIGQRNAVVSFAFSTAIDIIKMLLRTYSRNGHSGSRSIHLLESGDLALRNRGKVGCAGSVCWRRVGQNLSLDWQTGFGVAWAELLQMCACGCARYLVDIPILSDCNGKNLSKTTSFLLILIIIVAWGIFAEACHYLVNFRQSPPTNRLTASLWPIDKFWEV